MSINLFYQRLKRTISQALIVLCTLVLHTSLIIAQTGQFEHLTTRNGLTQNHINCIFQDNEGFIWIGTFNGLSRYDGYKFKNYYNEVQNKRSLSHQSVNVIFQDKNNNMWIGTENGLNRFNRKTNDFSRYYLSSDVNGKIISNDINTIYEDKKGNLWIGFYGEGLKKFNPPDGQFYNIPELSSSGLKYVNAFFIDKNNIIWIGTERNGLISFNPETKSFKKYKKDKVNLIGISDSCISAIAEDKIDNLWIGTWDGGLNKLNKKTDKFTIYKSFSQDNKVSNNTITSLTFDNKEQLWVSTFGQGLIKFSTRDEKYDLFIHEENNSQSISHNVVWNTYKDRSGVIWVGTYGGGLNKYSPIRSNFESYYYDKRKNNWLNNNLILACYEGDNNSIYLGTFGGGVNIFNRETKEFSYLLQKEEFKNRTIRCLYKDKEKRLWVGTDAGVYKFDSTLKKRTFYVHSHEKHRVGTKSIYSIIQDRNGDMWFGLWTGGLKRLAKKEAAKINPNQAVFESFDYTEFKNTTVWSLFEDSEGYLWVGASKSLYRYNKNQNEFEEFEPDIKKAGNTLHFSVSCFFEDTYQNKLWFGTLGNGVGCFNLANKQFQFLSKESTISHDEIYNIESDKNNNLWVSSNHGVLRYDIKLKQFQDISIVRDTKNKEVNDRLWKLKSGEILVGGNKGFYIFNPEEFFENAYNPKIVLTDFKIFNKSLTQLQLPNEYISSKEINELDEIHLSYKENFFAIEFAALDYRAPENNKFLYILEGYDKDWINSNSENRIATYANLEGGEYIFKVRATNSDGIWSSDTKQLKIIISSPFYYTTVFKLAVGLLLLIILYIIYTFKKIVSKEKLLEKDKGLIERELAFERNKFEALNRELEDRLGKNEKELAASKLYIQDKDENLLTLRSQLTVIHEHAKTALKPKIRALIKTIDNELKEKKGWDSFKENIDILQNDFIKRLAADFPKLTQKDLKICSFILMGKTNKEMAGLLNISVQSVEMSRYRIRKKMSVDSKTSLNDFLVRF